MKKYIWNNLKDLWLKVKKIKFVDLLSLYMDLNKHQNNGMKNLIIQCCHMDLRSMNVISVYT